MFMKKLFFMSLCLAISSSWGQQVNNQSRGAIDGATPVILTVPTPTPIPVLPGLASGVEAFRFKNGLITQSDAGGNFGFGADTQWFSLGKLNVGSGLTGRTLYGFRLQSAGQGLTMGYGGATQPLTNEILSAERNPFIEWIGNDGIQPTPVGAGDFQFLTATNPGGPGGAAVRKLSFTLRSNLTSLFAETSLIPTSKGRISPKVEINVSERRGLVTTTSSSTSSKCALFTSRNIGGNTSTSSAVEALATGAGINNGILAYASAGLTNTGISSVVNNTTSSGIEEVYSANVPISVGAIIPYQSTSTGIKSLAISTGLASSTYGVFAQTSGINSTTGAINYGVYASATGPANTAPANTVPTSGTYAGYFAGAVYASSIATSSDISLKSNIKKEESSLEKLTQLNPVTYNYNPDKDGLRLNHSNQLQHGFVAQELEKVFPEMVTNLIHPTFNEKNEQVGTKTLKAVNYNGLISILTASMKEMSAKIVKLEEKLASHEKVVVVRNNNSLSNNEIDLINEKGYFLGQNTPNPFKNSTVIEYSLPVNEKNASILIFNLNGQTLKEYKLSETKGSITIDSTVLSKGLYLYSLISDGQEIATKKMLMN